MKTPDPRHFIPRHIAANMVTAGCLALLLSGACAPNNTGQANDSGTQDTGDQNSASEDSSTGSGQTTQGGATTQTSGPDNASNASAESSVSEASNTEEADSEASANDSITETDSSDEASDNSSESGDPNGPKIVDLDSTSDSITEGGSVTVIALVSDPDGPDDILGGKLLTADGRDTVGSFSTDNGGTFTATLTWDQLHQLQPINFDGGATQEFIVEFFDASGHTAEKRFTLELNCEHSAACNGRCVNLEADDENCGACGHACREDPDPSCSNRQCGPSMAGCIARTTSFENCTEYCESIGESCAQNSCGDRLGTISRFDNVLSCEEWINRPRPANCSDPFPFDVNFQAFRCCCTDTQ